MGDFIEKVNVLKYNETVCFQFMTKERVCMKVSIAMATYNGEKFIKEQLDSLKNQTYPIDEVIICDDQSKDDTVSIVKEYVETNGLSHWNIIVNRENKGFIGNFFGSIENTTGDVIFMCDQDDVWNSEKVQEMVSFLQKHPDVDALNTAVMLIDEKGEPIPVKQKRGYCNANILHKVVRENETSKIDFSFLVKGNVSPGCTMCITKSLKEKILPFKDLCVTHKFPHDWFFNLVAALEHHVAFYNKPLTGYRMHENNTIGLEKEEEGNLVAIKSSREMRQEIGEFHLKRAELIAHNLALSEEQKRYINKYLQFTLVRYAFLQKFSFIKWLRVLGCGKIYVQSISLKGVISDFLYACKLDKIIRK